MMYRYRGCSLLQNEGMKTYTKPRELYEYLCRFYAEEIAHAITQQLNTDFTAGRMLRYLHHMEELRVHAGADKQGYTQFPPGIEELVDEMVAILEDRERYVEKIIRESRKIEGDDLFLRSFDISCLMGTESEDKEDSYIENIPALSGLKHFDFTSNITFFVGENGTGKSTLLEALAIACGLNPEGGTRSYKFSTYDDYSGLSHRIKLTRGTSKPKWSYFLRAESFYNVATAAMREYNPDGRMKNLHARSHGESFMDFILEADQPGLYFMDEPEAALSPQRQLTLLIHLVRMARKGAQFIIVTHSPILLGTPDADIYSFDDGEVAPVAYEDTESYQLTKLFLENRDVMIRRLLSEEEYSEAHQR